MTKYVLQSGGIKNNPKLKKRFHNEIITGLGNSPKILFCEFAQPRENWEEEFVIRKTSVLEDAPQDVQPIFELAMPKNFTAQCKWADVIYICGGDDHLLQYWLRQFDLPMIFKDKVVATNSASSNALAKSFWTCDWRQCMDGLGILPIKFIPHYLSNWGLNDPRGPINWQQVYDNLAKYGDEQLPIYALKEGEFKVYAT